MGDVVRNDFSLTVRQGKRDVPLRDSKVAQPTCSLIIPRRCIAAAYCAQARRKMHWFDCSNRTFSVPSSFERYFVRFIRWSTASIILQE